MNSDAFFAFSAIRVLFSQVGPDALSPFAERACWTCRHVALHANAVRAWGARADRYGAGLVL